MKTVVAGVVAVIAIAIVFFTGLHFGQKQSNITDQANGPVASVQPKPDTSKLDDMVANYNPDLHLYEQDEQKEHSLDQEEHDNSGTALAVSLGNESLKLTYEQGDIIKRLPEEYKAIAADHNFQASYRQTTYISAHGDSDQAWANLRYLEHK